MTHTEPCQLGTSTVLTLSGPPALLQLEEPWPMNFPTSSRRAATTSLLFALAFCVCSQSANAAVVGGLEVFTKPVDLVGGINEGRLAGTGTSLNGAAALDILIDIRDIADTGAIFQSILTISGTLNNGSSAVFANGAGKTLFSSVDASTNASLTFTMSAPTFVAAPGPASDYVATFDGFKNFRVDGFQSTNDKYRIGGTVYSGNPSNATFHTHSFEALTGSLAASGLTVENAGGASVFNIAGIRPEFTVSATSAAAVPEPSSFALLGLGAIGVLIRRRRKATQIEIA